MRKECVPGSLLHPRKSLGTRLALPLPLPDGPLSMQVPASGIAAANKTAILPEATSETGRQEWGAYDHFTAEEKA